MQLLDSTTKKTSQSGVGVRGSNDLFFGPKDEGEKRKRLTKDERKERFNKLSDDEKAEIKRRRRERTKQSRKARNANMAKLAESAEKICMDMESKVALIEEATRSKHGAHHAVMVLKSELGSLEEVVTKLRKKANKSEKPFRKTEVV